MTKEFNWDNIPVTKLVTADPAAGSDPAAYTTVPAGSKWRVVAAFNAITTSGDVADRYPYLEINWTGSGSFLYAMQPTPVTASITAQKCQFALGVAPAAAIGSGLLAVTPLLDVALPPGTIARFRYLAIEAADNATAAALYYQEAPL